jgi:hypothetical protein
MLVCADIGLHDDGPLVIDGDLSLTASSTVGGVVVNDCDSVHVSHLLMSEPGNWRFSPEVGPALSRYLNAPSSPAMQNELRTVIRKAIEAGGIFRVVSIDVDPINVAFIRTSN